MTPAPFPTLATAYAAWLRKAPPRAEVIAGAHSGPLPRGALSDAERSPGDAIAAGGYGEDRSDYSSPLFAPADGSAPRTVHLGLDLFAPPGAEVFAPLDGRIHSFRDNAGAQDYGPTLILEHSLEGDGVFHTLYGHLSRDSLLRLEPGAPVAAGARIGRLGERGENGGWPPHLHVQVILDIGGRQGDFPGVCRRSESHLWLAVCPDPAPLLGVRLGSGR